MRVVAIFSPLRGRISEKALLLLEKQREKALADKKAGDRASKCTGTFRLSMGLPCSHEIQRIIASQREKVITISDIDSYWLLKPERAIEKLAAEQGRTRIQDHSDNEDDRSENDQEDDTEDLSSIPATAARSTSPTIPCMFIANPLPPISRKAKRQAYTDGIYASEPSARHPLDNVARSGRVRTSAEQEMVRITQQRRQPTCGTCKKIGHKSNHCPQAKQDALINAMAARGIMPTGVEAARRGNVPIVDGSGTLHAMFAQWSLVNRA